MYPIQNTQVAINPLPKYNDRLSGFMAEML
jgi:hypothetical protein